MTGVCLRCDPGPIGADEVTNSSQRTSWSDIRTAFLRNLCRLSSRFSEKQFSFTKKVLDKLRKSDYKGARLMHEIFILHIKTFNSKWVCFRPLADWASPVTNQMLSRVVRGSVGAVAKQFRVDVEWG